MRAASLLVLATVGVAPSGADPQALAAIDRFQKAYTSLLSLEFRMQKTERLEDGEVVKEEVLVKLRKPHEIYLGSIQPNAGREVIYTPRLHRHKLTAHKGSFPDLTVELSIFGGMATDNQHHTILATGYAFLLGQIRDGAARAARNPSGERIEYLGAVRMHGREAERIVIHAGTRPHKRVKAKHDESLFAFAKREACDAYLIAYYNPSLDGLTDDVEAGDTYIVPHYYGKTVELILDQETALSLRTSIWDFEGNLYERYEQFDIIVNPAYTDLTFDPENPAYDF